MKHTIKRTLVVMLAAAIIFGLLPSLNFVAQVSAAKGDIEGDTGTKIVGTLDQGATVSLPITVRDYDNDGMLFEYAEHMASGTNSRTVAVDSTVAKPVTATGYNAEQGESFAGPAANATVSYGTDDGRYYHFVHGDGSASAQVGAGLGARFRINYKSSRYSAAATQYVAVRYRVASVSTNSSDGNNTLTASILGSTVQVSSGGFNEVRPDNCVRSDFDLDTDGQWHTAIVSMAEYISTTPNYLSYPNYISWTSNLYFYSYYFALEYNVNLGETVDVAYVAFFPTKAQAQAYTNQCDCYRTDSLTLDYTVEPGVPEKTIGVDVRSGESFDGSGSAVESGVSYYYSDEGGRFWGVSDIAKGGYGIGVRALLMKNVYSCFQATMDDIRYVAIRYRANSTGYEKGAQIPLYLFAENQSLGYYNQNDFMTHTSTRTDETTGETVKTSSVYFSNRLSTFTRFYAVNDGQWQTAVVDFADYVYQYPTGEGYYYQPYHGTDMVGRIGFADERALMYNDIDVSYVAFFADEADAQAYNAQYTAYLNGSLEATTATYTAQMTDTTETWNYQLGNNRAFGLLVNSAYMTSGRGNYYASTSIGNTVDGISVTSTSYSNISRYNSALHGTYNGTFTVGLTKNELVNGMLTYKDETVNYLASLLKTTLSIPETFTYNNTTYHSYNFVQGRPNGEKYGYYDAEQTKPRDYAGYLRYALGMTQADGTDKLSGTTVAARAASIDNLGSPEDTMAKVAAGSLSLDWSKAKDQIKTCYDAAYFMLNSLFYDGGVSDTVSEYKYLQLTQETKNNKTYYVFDGGYTNVLYDYGTGIISNSGSEDDSTVGAIKPFFWYSTSATTTLYPFLPILEEMGDSYTHTDTPYYLDDGVDTLTEGKDSYVKRDFNYALDGHAKFVYNADEEQYFTFEGDDDVYLYVNGHLVLDLGGAHGIASETIRLNDYAAAIGLEDGGIYDFDFYYMERHGYGANMRIETNIEIYNDNLAVSKTAMQNGTPVENNGIIDKNQELAYSIALTNESDNTQYNLFFNDEAIDFYAGYDMSTEIVSGTNASVLGSFKDANGNTVYRNVCELTLTVENPKYDTRVYHPESLTALKNLLVALDETGSRDEGLGLRPGDTVTLSGIRYFIQDSDWKGSTGGFEGMFTNTVYVRAGVDPGVGKFSVVGTGNPVYYMWKGHPLTVPISDVMSGYTGIYNASDIIRCTIGGTALANTAALSVDTAAGTVTFNYNVAGTQQCYFSTGGDVLSHVTVYVYDVQDNTYVLDYGLPVDLTENNKSALTGNDVLSISGVATNTAWEAFTVAAPEYCANRLHSTDWLQPSDGGRSFISGREKQHTETSPTEIPYPDPAASYVIGYRVDKGESFNAVSNFSNGTGSYVGTASENSRYYHMAPNDKGYDMGFRVRAYGNSNGTVKVSDANYVAIRYRVQSGSTDEDFHVLLGTTYAGLEYPSNGNCYRADITLPADGQWHTATLCISDNLVSKYDTTSSVYLSSWDVTKTVKEIWLATGYNDTKTVDIGYVAFFGTQAAADEYNTAYTHFINGDTYIDTQTVTTDLTPDEGSAIGYSIADGAYFNNTTSTASGTAVMNGTLNYNAESTANPAYAEVISSVSSGDTGYGFGARTLVWADTANGTSGSNLQVIAIRYRVAEYAGGDCSIGVLATRTKGQSGTTIGTSTAAPAAAKFAANTDGQWHTEYVLMGQNPYAQSNYTNYAGTTNYSYSSFGTSYTYYQLFVAQQWVAQNKIDYAYVLGFDSLAAAQVYDAAFEDFYYQDNPAQGTEAGTVNPTGLDGTYGSFVGSLADQTLRFTPSQFMNGPSEIYLTLRVSDAEYTGSTKMSDIDIHHEVEMAQKITTVPASVVYYEDDFASINYATENTQATITPGNPSTGLQDADQTEAYGHDSSYEAGALDSSAGSDTVIEATGGKVFSFDFTGTGFEILSRIEAAASATLDVRVYDKDNTLVYNFPVITEYDNGGDDAGSEMMYQVPVISYNELEYGEYTVEVWVVSRQDYDGWTIGYDTENSWVYYTNGSESWKSEFNATDLTTSYYQMKDAYTPNEVYAGTFGDSTTVSPSALASVFHVDGVRIYNPLSQDDAATYYDPSEANAQIINIRNLIATGRIAFAEFAENNMLLGTQAYTFVENRNNVLSDGETELSGNEVNGVADYLRLGPNDEVWLNGMGKTQGIVLYVKPDTDVPSAERTLQIGAHRIDESVAVGQQADGVSLKAASLSENNDYGFITLISDMKSGTEQYYRIDPTQSLYDDENGYLVLITAENGMVSLSNIKVKGYLLTAFTEGFAGEFAPWGDPEKLPEQTEQAKTALRRVMQQVALFLTADESLNAPSDNSEQLKIRSASLKLDEDIDVIYTAQIPNGFENPYMVFTYRGESFTVTDYSIDAQGCCCFEFSGVTPQCMAENISAVLYATKDGIECFDTVSQYSVRTYCANQLSRYADQRHFVTLLSDLLTYGAAAQRYTGYCTDALVTDGLRLTPSVYSGQAKQYVTYSGSADETVDWKAATLCLSSSLAVRFTFRAATVEDLLVQVSLNGRIQTFDADDFTAVEGKNDTWYITFRNISATEFDDAVAASFVRGGETVGRTVVYSVNTYICNAQNTDAAANLAQMLQALYNYGVAAKAYSGIQEGR